MIINICAFQLFHVKTDTVKKLSSVLHRTETVSNYRTTMSLRDYFIDRKPRKTTISSLAVPWFRYSLLHSFSILAFCWCNIPFPPQRQIMFCPDITCAYLGWEFSSYILSLASLKRLMVCFVLFVKLSMTTRKYSFSPRISILPSYLDRMVRKCW